MVRQKLIHVELKCRAVGAASMFCWQQWTLSAMWKLLKQKSFHS